MAANLTTRDVSVLLKMSRQRFRALRERFPTESPIPKKFGNMFFWSNADVAVFRKLYSRLRAWGPYRQEASRA